MIKLQLSALGLFFTLTAWCQQQIGGYLSFQEFADNSPTYAGNFFKIYKRSKAEIVLGGGNDFRIISATKNIPQGKVKRDLWGVYKNDTLYVNAKPVMGTMWYSRVMELGRYDFVKFPFPLDKQVQRKLGLAYVHGGAAVGNSSNRMSGSKRATTRLPFVFDSQGGQFLYLTEESLFQLLKPKPVLQQSYSQETEKLSEDVIIRYLSKLNE